MIRGPAPETAVTPALLLVPVLLAAPLLDPPDIDRKVAKQVEALLEEFFQHDGRSREGLSERERILEEVDRLAPDPLTAKETDRWRDAVLEAWETGPEIPKKTGREHFWEDDERGLYIIGGVTKKPKGLLIGMHGGGVGMGDCSEAAGFLGSAAKKRKWAAIFPEVLEKTEHGWTTSGTEEWVLELVDRARRTYGVDADHVYFAGHSMGGFGSWTLGAHHADRVAALGPAAGAPTPYVNAQGQVWDIAAGVVPNLRNVAMRVYQSADDPKVPPDANRVAVEKVGEARERWGGYEDFEYIEVDGQGHAYPPGGGKDWLEGLADFERQPHPGKVVWQPSLWWKRQFYWLAWDDPVKEAIVVAEVVEPNHVRVTVEKDGKRLRPKGLWLLVNPGVFDDGEELVVELEGEEVWRGVPERRLSTLLRTGAYGDDGLMAAARVPVGAAGR